ncbi:hypothetical protein OS493_039769, partial [Desmophyllum pertusum]
MNEKSLPDDKTLHLLPEEHQQSESSYERTTGDSILDSYHAMRRILMFHNPHGISTVWKGRVTTPHIAQTKLPLQKVVRVPVRDTDSYADVIVVKKGFNVEVSPV